MGDCLIRFRVESKLLATVTVTVTSYSYTLSADTTIRELFDVIKVDEIKSIRKLVESKAAFLWNCSFYPPTNISDWSSREDTLYSCGLFPSCNLYLTAEDTPPSANASAYDDVQYNSNQREHLHAKGKVTLVNGDNDILPSQLLQSAARRFDNEETTSTEEAKAIQRQNALERKRKQRARFDKLEAKIQELEGKGSKNKNVSQQVRNMLIKSRSTGRANLRMEDRVFLHCIIQDGDKETKEDYRYFSRLETVGKVLSSFQLKSKGMELLIKTKGDEAEYQRLPIMMQLQDTIDAEVLISIDQVIIRGFDPSSDEPTEEFQKEAAEFKVEDEQADARVSSPDEVTDALEGPKTVAGNIIEDQSLYKQLFPEDPKKKKASVEKVRQMKLKSQAKGDTKRVKNVQDRFFVEIFVLRSDKIESRPIFVAKGDTWERLFHDAKLPIENDKVDLLVPVGEGHFSRVDITKSVDETIMNFDRVVLKWI